MSSTSRFTRSVFLSLGAFLFACTDSPTAPRTATVIVRLMTPATVAIVTVEVSGPGITPAVVVNIPVGADSVAWDTLTVTAGSGRRFVVTAVDTAGVQTHRADTTITLLAGANAPLAMRLDPLASTLGITVTFGGYRLTIADTSARELLTGDSVRIVANAWWPDGSAVPVDSLVWGSSKPAIATVDAEWVRGIRSGVANIVVSHRGAAARVRVVVNASVDVTSRTFTSGNYYTCGISEAGEAYCWGENTWGQLGDGSFVNRPEPVPVGGGIQFEALSAGSQHTCGLTGAGVAYCWGGNPNGQLGTGNNVDSSSPALVNGGHTFRSIAVGSSHSCALTGAGEAFCWGFNNLSQLGDGSQVASNVPVRVAGNHIFKAIDSGNHHTCGVTLSGAAYCWGWNLYGQLGAGFASNWSAPVAVVGGIEFAVVEVGGAHSCGISRSGSTYCWGQNARGQLGDGSFANESTYTNVSTPSPVLGNHSFELIAVRGSHSCGARGDGVALCWGMNHKGQLGNGTTGVSSPPVLVAATVSFAVLQAGTQHTCALTPDGLAYCWGGNERGQLGESTFEDRLVPGPVVGGIKFRLP